MGKQINPGIPAPEEDFSAERKKFLLNRRRAKRAEKKLSGEEEKNRIFDRRLREAPSGRAPFTLRTKAYYRFAKDYPSEVDGEGFRENSLSKKRKARRRTLFALVLILVFCAGFTGAKVCMNISARPADDINRAPAQGEYVFSEKALRISYADLARGDADYICGLLDEKGCRTALFELKDDFGYVMFSTGSFRGMSADKRIAGADETVAAVKRSGYKIWAYISCFKDSCASAADLTLSVRKNTYEGGAWLDNSSYGHLDPFSAGARDYIYSLVEYAAKTGFDAVVLGNADFSTDAGNANAYYAWQQESDITRNAQLKSFIAKAADSAGKMRVITLLNVEAFDITATEDTPGYFGNMLDLSTGICLDARADVYKNSVSSGKKAFLRDSSMPYVFALSTGEYVKNALTTEEGGTSPFYMCLQNDSTVDEQLLAAGYCSASGVIIW